MKLPLFQRIVDERFRNHRLRSTSLGGIAGAVMAWALFEWRYWFRHMVSWDLLAVLGTIVVVKLAVMGWSLWRE